MTPFERPPEPEKKRPGCLKRLFGAFATALAAAVVLTIFHVFGLLFWDLPSLWLLFKTYLWTASLGGVVGFLFPDFGFRFFGRTLDDLVLGDD